MVPLQIKSLGFINPGLILLNIAHSLPSIYLLKKGYCPVCKLLVYQRVYHDAEIPEHQMGDQEESGSDEFNKLSEGLGWFTRSNPVWLMVSPPSE